MKKTKEQLEKQLKHTEDLLSECISCLWEYWDNEDTDTIRHYFKDNLGFTDEDMHYWYIEQELKRIEWETSEEDEDYEEDEEEDIILPWEKY